jgi:hypothetical protein
MELLCHRAFRRKGRRVYLDGDGMNDIILPDRDIKQVVSASIADLSGTVTTLTSAEITDLVAYPWGVLHRRTLGSWTQGYRNVQVLYEYGPSAAPEPVKRATLALARQNLVGLSLFDRARSEAVDGGILSFTLAGRDGPTGIPEVDAVIAQYSRQIPHYV